MEATSHLPPYLGMLLLMVANVPLPFLPGSPQAGARAFDHQRSAVERAVTAALVLVFAGSGIRLGVLSEEKEPPWNERRLTL